MRKFLLSLSEFDLDRSELSDLRDKFRDEDWMLKAKFLDKIQKYMDRLPPLEQDVVELIFFRKKKQETVASMLGISQQAVSHRMYNAFKRILFMMSIPEIEDHTMRHDLASYLENPFTIDVLCDFSKTSSQTLTAKNLTASMGIKVSQQRVCWHLNSAIEKLKAHQDAESVFYRGYFEKLMANRNILREVLAGRRRKSMAEISEI